MRPATGVKRREIEAVGREHMGASARSAAGVETAIVRDEATQRLATRGRSMDG